MPNAVIALFVGLLVLGCGNNDDATGGSSGLGGSGGSGWPPEATVYFDAFGIPSADCDADEDCAMVLGYYHARDRWVQMDLRRRLGTGRLTDVVNKELVEAVNLLEPLLDAAESSRALSSTRTGQPAEEFALSQATPKTRLLLDAYAVGVNQWLRDVRAGDNGAKWPDEFASELLSYAPEDAVEWTPQDSLAAILVLIENLTNDERTQIVASRFRNSIGDDARFSDLWSKEPLKKSSVLKPGEYTPGAAAKVTTKGTATRDSALRRRAGPALERLQSRLEQTQSLRRLVLPPGLRGEDIGSNNWALGPELSENGNTLFCNDSHLGFSQPSVWYIAHLDAKTNGSGSIHTAGLTFAGLPWVVLGQNESIAWGATNTNFDLSDVYIEELVKDETGAPTGVMFNGAMVPFVKVDTTFSFVDGTSATRELLFVPHHGPVREIDVDNNIALSLRWTGNDVDTDLNFLTELAAANNVQEARTAAANVTSVGQNWVVVDNQGNFGWFPYNRVPKRTWATGLQGDAPPWLPLDGTGAFEWDTFFELAELPQALNRASGYVATANNDMTGALSDGDPSNDGYVSLQTDVATAFRHARIVELIEARSAHTPSSMHSAVDDVYSSIGRDMTPAILALANDDMTTLTPAAQRVVNALSVWDYTCPTGLDGDNAEMSPLVVDAAQLTAASGCAAFHVALEELENFIANDEASPGFPNFVTYFSIVDSSRLAAGDVYWDNVNTSAVESKYEVLAIALDTAGQFLETTLGADEGRWAWGRLHRLSLQSDLAGLSNLFAVFNNPPPGEPPFALDGGLYTIDVANPGDDFRVTAGASMRFCCEGTTPNVSCTIQLPGGQSSDVMSQNYDDLLDLWLDNEPIDMAFDIGLAAEDAIETVVFQKQEAGRSSRDLGSLY